MQVAAGMQRLGFDAGLQASKVNHMTDDEHASSTPKRHAPRRPRNYFSRREQYRLLSLVFTLLLVIFLMFEAAKPANWQWMWQLGGAVEEAAADEAADIDTRLPPPASEPVPADVFLSTVAEDADTESRQVVEPNVLPGVAELDLDRLQDDTVFRGVESPLWYGVLGALDEIDAKTLESNSLGSVGFTQLFRQTDQYRGRTVTVSGTVRRAFPLQAGQNETRIESYWQCWLQPDGSPNPIVVYSLAMPDEFPQGMSLRERVDFTGVVYKRWAYAAQEGTRTAPLILAKAPVWTKATPAPAKTPASPQAVTLVAVAALLAAGCLTWLVYCRTRTKKRVVPGSIELVASLVLASWLASVPLLAQEGATVSQPAIQTTEAFLQLFEVDDKQLARIATAASADSIGSHIDSETQEATLRLFNALRRCPTSILRNTAELLNEPGVLSASKPGQAVRMQGQVQQIERISLTDDLRERFGVPAFYRCQCTYATVDQPRPLVILASKIPQRWESHLVSPELDEPSRLRAFSSQQISCSAITLAGGSDIALATERIAWHPRQPDESIGLVIDHVLLASHGMDIGQLDEVRPKGPLTAHDRAAFYQMLLAMGRIPSSELATAARSVNVTELLQNTDSHRGKLYDITGTARRCVRILVDDEQADEFGLSSYYELVVFLDPDALVKVRSDESDAGKYFATYPVVVCVRNLPEGFPTGEEIHAAVRVVGSYLKLWAYPSKFMQADGSKALQFSPLLIGDAPQLTPAAKITDPLSGPGLAIAFAALLFLLSALVWWWSRGDEKFKRETLSRKYELPPETSLDDLS
jgi:hypothetical protein